MSFMLPAILSCISLPEGFCCCPKFLAGHLSEKMNTFQDQLLISVNNPVPLCFGRDNSEVRPTHFPDSEIGLNFIFCFHSLYIFSMSFCSLLITRFFYICIYLSIFMCCQCKRRNTNRNSHCY